MGFLISTGGGVSGMVSIFVKIPEIDPHPVHKTWVKGLLKAWGRLREVLQNKKFLR